MTLIEHRLQECGRASHIPPDMCLIDLQEARGSVDRTLLRGVLARAGVPPRMIKVIFIFHDGMRAWVQQGGGEQRQRFHICRRLEDRGVFCSRYCLTNSTQYWSMSPFRGRPSHCRRVGTEYVGLCGTVQCYPTLQYSNRCGL